jgi:hypothetical protein
MQILQPWSDMCFWGFQNDNYKQIIQDTKMYHFKPMINNKNLDIIVYCQIATNFINYYKHLANLSPLNFVDI